MTVEELLTMKEAAAQGCRIHLVHEKNPTTLYSVQQFCLVQIDGVWVDGVAYTPATKFGPLYVRALTDCAKLSVHKIFPPSA